MKEQVNTDFQEVMVHLRKDFQFDDAEPLGEDGPGSVLNSLKNILGGVDSDTFCLLEYDIKLRLIRETSFTPRAFQKSLKHSENLLRQIILDNPCGVIAVHLTGREFPQYVDWTGRAPGVINSDIAVMQQLGPLLELANIQLLDYMISDYRFERQFDFLAENILIWPRDIASQYLSFAKPLAGMEIRPESLPQKAHENDYPAEISPSWHYSGSKNVSTPEDAIFAVRDLIQDADREIIGVINLDGWRPLNFQLSAVGSGSNVGISSSLLLRTALLSDANAIILFHNHPAGSLEPSTLDYLMTEKVRCLCGKCGITVIDHIIIGFNTDFCFSFYRNSIFDAEHKETPFKVKSMSVHVTPATSIEKEIEGVPENIAAEKSAVIKRRSFKR